MPKPGTAAEIEGARKDTRITAAIDAMIHVFSHGGEADRSHEEPGTESPKPEEAVWTRSVRRPERPLYEALVRDLLAAFEKRESEGEREGLPMTPETDGLLRDALRERATDIHLDMQMDGMLVRLRIDGIVLDGCFLELDRGHRLLNQVKMLAGLDLVPRFGHEEGRITHAVDGMAIDMRIAHALCLRGDKMSIRLFEPRTTPLHLEDLGLHEEGLEHIEEWLDNVNGILLVAGPTGSGKTTTLYALLHRLKRYERNVVTIEDPVEYEIEGINHMQVNPKRDFGFAEGVKVMLRLDPDYLMLGEIRDAISAEAAIAAAASGRALMSTLHSRDAVGAIEVLRNFGMSGHKMSANLILVVAQRLVRVLCPHCRVEEEPDEDEKRWLGILQRKVPDKVWHARGCEHCNSLGYRGRTGVFEVWRIDREEYQLILEDADRLTLYRHLAGRGHRFLIDDGLEKAARGMTTLSELRGMGGVSAVPTIDVMP